MRAYAIGDIHGHFNEVQRLHELIAIDRAQTGDMTAPVVHLGDLVDRGPSTRQILDYMIAGLAEGAPWVCLLGNHESAMWHWCQTPSQGEVYRPTLDWMHPNAGGRATIASYGVDVSAHRTGMEMHRDAVAAIPKAHLNFITGLKTHHQIKDVFFCHAGIRPGVPLRDQTDEDLIWIRDEFLQDPRDHGALIVHGHTPVEQIEHHGNHLNIDTGAAWGKPASAVVFEDSRIFALGKTGRRLIRPGSA